MQLRQVVDNLVQRYEKNSVLRALVQLVPYGSVVESAVVTKCQAIRTERTGLDLAKTASDVNLPGWRLHQLTGDLSGYYSIVVSGNWRVTFKFEGEDVVLVDYLDYH